MAEDIRQAITTDDFDTLGKLIREYFEWMFDRYGDRRAVIEAIGGHQGIDNELQDLSHRFSPPAGKAFLASHGDQSTGCVAYKVLDDKTAEMKRLFVPEEFQGDGLGRRLAQLVVDQARDDGFEIVKLDTGFLHEEAMTMYESMGFRPCEPYVDYPPELMPHLRFFEKDLLTSGG